MSSRPFPSGVLKKKWLYECKFIELSQLRLVSLWSACFKNRFITVLAVDVVFVNQATNPICVCVCVCVCVLFEFLTAWFRFAIWCQVCFLWGIYLHFEVETEDLQLYSSALSCEFFMWQTHFLVSLTCFLAHWVSF